MTKDLLTDMKNAILCSVLGHLSTIRAYSKTLTSSCDGSKIPILPNVRRKCFYWYWLCSREKSELSFVTTTTVTVAFNFLHTLCQGRSLSYMAITSAELFRFILRLVTLTYSKVTGMLLLSSYVQTFHLGRSTSFLHLHRLQRVHKLQLSL